MESDWEESEKLWRSLVRYIPDVVATIARDGRVEALNRTLSGRPAKEAVGTNIRDHLLPESAEAFSNSLEKVFQTGEPESVVTKAKVPGQKEVRHLENRLVPNESDGQIVGATVLVRDITDSMRAEDALRESERRYRLLAENVTDVIWTMDLDLRFTYVSPSVKAMSGYNTEEALNRTIDQVLAPNSMELARRTLAEEMALESESGSDPKRSRTLDLELINKDGSTTWAEMRMSFLRDEAGRPTGILGVTRDIGERKRAEESLRESEELYRTLVDTSPDGIGIFDFKGNILKSNKQAAKIVGYENPEELVGIKIADFIEPRDMERFAGRMDFLRSGGGGETIEYTLVRKDGSQLVGEVRATGIPGGDGTPKYGMAIIRDVTERRRAEEALRASEEKFSKTFHSSPIGMMITRLEDGKVLDLNLGFERITGYRLEDVLGRTSVGEGFWVRPEEREEVTGIVRRDGVFRDLEFEYRHKSGDVRLGLFSSELIDIEGETCILSAMQDITKRKRVEEELQREKEFAESIVQTAPVIILLLDREGRIVSFNPYMERISGYKSKEVEGKEWIETFLPERDRARIRELFSKAVDDIPTRGNVNPIVTKDGEEREIEWHDSIVKNADGKIVALLSLGRDITERTQAEEDLRTYQERLKSLATQLLLVEEKERRRIATELHDEIGQTLAMINIKLGELRKEKTAKKLAGPLDKVQNLCKKAIQDTRSLTFELSPPVLYELGFEAAVAWLAERYTEEHGIPVGYEDDNETKSLGENLRVLMFQSVRELLNNAVRYSKAGEVWVRVGREGDDIRVEVEDNGVGFDPSGLKQKEGFGLFNIHERISSVGGRFIVRSVPGEGTRVVLMAPLKDGEIQ